MRVPARSFILLLLLASGCDSTLETGYAPKALNATDSERRAYYAPQFSPESHPSKDTGGTADMFRPH